MQWLEPDWAPPGAQWSRLRACLGWREYDAEISLMSSQFYEKLKRSHDEVISSRQSQLMITRMKERSWCQFTYFTTVFVTFLVQFWWCQDWVPRLNICLLVVRSLFREIKTSHKLWECFNFAAEQLTKNTSGRKLECQQEILWSKFRNKILMSHNGTFWFVWCLY